MNNMKQENGVMNKQLAKTGSILTVLFFSALASSGVIAASQPQQNFNSPEQAAAALADAWHNGSTQSLVNIFGSGGLKLVSSGDPVAEKNARSHFAEEYAISHKFENIDTNKVLLIIGKDDFPYPIPLLKQGNRWHFDIKSGAEEIISRRIGRNELNAINVCRTYVEAQREYALKKHAETGHAAYATKIVSSTGQHDGLYWTAANGAEISPLGPLFASAAAEGYTPSDIQKQTPYHGYYYKILTRQGRDAQGGAHEYLDKQQMTKGFALIAFPAKYGDSGVMSFIVNQHGVVYEKNLGPDTSRVARQIESYNPDTSWKPVAK